MTIKFFIHTSGNAKNVPKCMADSVNPFDQMNVFAEHAKKEISFLYSLQKGNPSHRN